MKTTTTAAMMFLECLAAASGQGPLTPPSSTPAPAMKTLQEIWDKLGEFGERVTRMTPRTAT